MRSYVCWLSCDCGLNSVRNGVGAVRQHHTSLSMCVCACVYVCVRPLLSRALKRFWSTDPFSHLSFAFSLLSRRSRRLAP